MDTYARLYGFRIFSEKEIRDHEEDYTWVADNQYISNGDYDQLEEILEKEV